MFIDDDEHVIIMEVSQFFPFSETDLMKLEDAGVRTIFLTHTIYWDQVFAPNWTDRNWSVIDSKLERFSKFNFKLTVPFHGHGMPAKFLWQDKDGWLAPRQDYIAWCDYLPCTPAYDNPEYIQAVDEFAKELFHRYSDGHIQFLYAIPYDGEFPFFPHWPDWPISKEKVLDFILGRQKLLVEQFGEVWTSFHNQTGIWNATHIASVYEMLQKEFPDNNRYAVQFEHFTHGTGTQLFVKKYAEEYGTRFFVGSNYVEGLLDNLQRGIDQKIWGFITAPLHKLNDVQHTQVEDWMIPVIRNANEKLCEAYK